MLEYFLSPAKADLLPTDGGSSARSDPPGYGPAVGGLQALSYNYDIPRPIGLITTVTAAAS